MVGFDTDPDALAIATANCEELEAEIDFVRCNFIENPPFKGQSSSCGVMFCCFAVLMSMLLLASAEAVQVTCVSAFLTRRCSSTRASSLDFYFNLQCTLCLRMFQWKMAAWIRLSWTRHSEPRRVLLVLIWFFCNVDWRLVQQQPCGSTVKRLGISSSCISSKGLQAVQLVDYFINFLFFTSFLNY